MSLFIDALKITWHSFAYRLRMREANNLAVSASMMIAFALPWSDIAYRVLYAALLNIYVYLFNDFFDISLDLKSPIRSSEKIKFMAANRRAAMGALGGLGGLLFIGGILHSWLLLLAFLCNTAMIVIYSAWLKRVPFADLVMMALAGASMTMVALPGQPLGWKLLGFLALVCASYEVIQVIRDEPHDRRNNIRTTAVLLGSKRAAWVFRILILFSVAYGLGFIGSKVALGLLLTLLVPLTPEKAGRSWDIARVIAGLVWLGLMVQVYVGYL